jgi:phage tail sheath gpL-like
MRVRTLLLAGLLAIGGTIGVGAAVAQTGNVSGKWQGTWAYQNTSLGSGQIVMTLAQSGTKATGNMVVTGTPVPRSGAVTVLVQGNDVYFVYPTGATGYLTVSGDEMKGQIDGVNPANVVLKRQK